MAINVLRPHTGFDTSMSFQPLLFDIILSFCLRPFVCCSSAYNLHHIDSIVCWEGRLGAADPVRADVMSCNGGRAAVHSSISTEKQKRKG